MIPNCCFKLPRTTLFLKNGPGRPFYLQTMGNLGIFFSIPDAEGIQCFLRVIQENKWDSSSGQPTRTEYCNILPQGNFNRDRSCTWQIPNPVPNILRIEFTTTARLSNTPSLPSLPGATCNLTRGTPVDGLVNPVDHIPSRPKATRLTMQLRY